MKKLLFGLLFVTPLAHASIDIQAKANGATCKKGFFCELTGSHYAVITNDTNDYHDYHYRFSLCADNGDCVNQQKDFQIAPHQAYEVRWDSHISTRFMVIAQHYNYAQTEISGYERKFIDNKAWVTVMN